MVFEQRTEKQIEKPQESHSAMLALEAWGSGIGSGFAQAAKDAWDHKLNTTAEIAAGAGFGGMLSLAERTVGSKMSGLGAAAFMIAGIAPNLVSSFSKAFDVYQNPDHYQADKQAIAQGLGRDAFTYALMTGAAGATSFGARKFLPAGDEAAPAFSGSYKPASSLSAVYNDANLMSSGHTIGIPQFDAGIEGKVPRIIMADDRNGLGKFYTDTKQSVVRIVGDNGAHMGVGTGFFVNEDGLIATNNHVISGFKNLKVETSDGNSYFVRPLARDKDADVALLQVLGANKPFRPIPLATNGLMKEDSILTSIGHPEGVKQEVLSYGKYGERVIGTDHPINPAAVGTPFAGPTSGDIISTVPVKPGYSGSPLMNDKGEAIGIVKMDGGNHSISTSVEHIRTLIGQADSKAPRGWLDVKSTFIPGSDAKAMPLGATERFDFPIGGNENVSAMVNRNFYTLREQPYANKFWKAA